MIQAIHPHRSATSIEADVVVIGAGFAGAASAYHLARQGVKRVIVLDKENAPGVHSSGRNASMIRQVVSEPTLAEMGRRGAATIRELAQELDDSSLFQASGSILIANEEKRPQLEKDANHARDHGIEIELWDEETTFDKYPTLRDIVSPGVIERACFCPSDGVVDIGALLSLYLDRARDGGAQVFLGAGVSAIHSANGKVEGVQFGETEVRAPIVVNASGGWARPLGDMAGASPVPLRPTRRHIFMTHDLRKLPSELPFVWDLGREIYFRPENGSAMLSPCDETHENADLQTDAIGDFARRLLRAKVRDQFPGFADVDIARGWSGIRTLTDDGLFMIGPDPRLEGFIWAAGLGGHGLTASSAVGELVANIVADPNKNENNPHRPSRFSPQRMREIASVQRV